MPPFAQVECLFRAPVEQAASQASPAVLTSTEGMGGFSLPGAVRLFARAQIGMVSQAELVLRLGRAMAIRFRKAMVVLSSGLSSSRTLASLGSVANSTLVDARNTIESSFLDVMRSQCHGLTSLHTDHHARGAGCWTQGVIGYAAAQRRSLPCCHAHRAAQTPLQPLRSLHPSPSSS